ncbi:MAG: site-2 protease family protein [Bifidobacteriaceae bacterium]|jgi:membrane-associated protease RseP (regulator of RpoE activity)|nr:site-2 protease family protein [Bifidobacteriaceae bacterium]
MTWPLTVLGIVVFAAALTVSVAWHELGHLLPAKAFGVRVTRYFVGFGPTVFSRTWGGTEYGLKALPLGGFIRMAGMYSPADTGRRPRFRWQAALESEVRHLSAAEVESVGVDHAFYRLSAPRKAVVMLGGPTMNLVLAIILTAVVFSGIGALTEPSLTLESVSPCAAPQTGVVSCDTDDAVPTPAAEAGLRAGDTLRTWQGVALDSWTAFQDAIQATGTTPAEVGIERDGRPETLTITPMPIDTGDGEPSGAVVVGVTSQMERVRLPLSAVPGILWSQIAGAAQAYARLPVAVWETVRATVGGEERDPARSPMSIVGIARLQGEATADSVGEDSSDVWASRWATWLSIAAMLNLALWLFNLLPLLPLDGGHVAGALIEGLRRTWARVRHRPRTGPLDLARAIPVTYGVFAAIILMTVALVWADIVNPISL